MMLVVGLLVTSISQVYANEGRAAEYKKVSFFEEKLAEERPFTDEEIYEYFESIGEPIDELEDANVEMFNQFSSADEEANWFNWTKWINRGGEWSLSIMPYKSKILNIALNPVDAWVYI